MNMHVCGVLPRASSEWSEKDRRANCSEAPYDYSRAQSVSQRWKEMGFGKNRRAHCSSAPYENARVRNVAHRRKELGSDKIGGLFAVGRHMNIHMCGMFPSAGSDALFVFIHF